MEGETVPAIERISKEIEKKHNKSQTEYFPEGVSVSIDLVVCFDHFISIDDFYYNTYKWAFSSAALL
jgi:hypothetical protein